MSLRLILLVAIVALNGFFAAAEVALVSVRRSRLNELAEQGNASARAALGLLANPGRLLSATQVGVTLASIFCLSNSPRQLLERDRYISRPASMESRTDHGRGS